MLEYIGGGLVTKSCLTLATQWTVTCQTPLSMEFSRQEYYSGLPFPSPGDLPDPGVEPTSFTSPALAGRFFTPCHLGNPKRLSTEELMLPNCGAGESLGLQGDPTSPA